MKIEINVGSLVQFGMDTALSRQRRRFKSGMSRLRSVVVASSRNPNHSGIPRTGDLPLKQVVRVRISLPDLLQHIFAERKATIKTKQHFALRVCWMHDCLRNSWTRFDSSVGYFLNSEWGIRNGEFGIRNNQKRPVA